MKTENDFPAELLQEIEAYAKIEGITVKEFIIWALSEKIGELRERFGLKNLIQINPKPRNEKINEDRVSLGSASPNSLLKAIEISKYLKMSKSGVYHLMQTGEIPVVKIGKSVRVREEDLEEYISKSKI